MQKLKFSFTGLCVVLSLVLQSCAPMDYKIPKSEEDYAYYGLEHKNAIDAIKYCHANEAGMAAYNGREELALAYKKLRDLVKNDNSNKEYPIPTKQSLGNRVAWYGVLVPIMVVISPIAIWSYFSEDVGGSEDKGGKEMSEPKTIAEHLDFCDKIYLKFLLDKKILEAEQDLELCESEMNYYPESKQVSQKSFEKFNKIEGDSAIGYLLKHYDADKSHYKGLGKFDLEGVERCVKFYKDVKSEEREQKINYKLAKEKDKAFANKYGYKDVLGNGIMHAISLVERGEISIEEAKQYLIKKAGSGSGLFLDAVVNIVHPSLQTTTPKNT